MDIAHFGGVINKRKKRWLNFLAPGLKFAEKLGNLLNFSNGFQCRFNILVNTLWRPWVSAPWFRIQVMKLRADTRKKL